MRITRAAKVAAFPILALALVALIACQGPAGVDGKSIKGEPGETGQGTPGQDALEALVVPVQIFNAVGTVRIVNGLSTMTDEEDDETEETATGIALAGLFRGGAAGDREYSIPSASEIFTGLSYRIEDGMLMLEAITGFVAAADEGTEDAVILVRAEDSQGNAAVAYVPVRANAPPARGSDQDTTLTIGTLAEETEDYAADDDATPPTWTVTCGKFNECVVDLSKLYLDNNRADTLTFMQDHDFADNVNQNETDDIDTDVAEKVTVVETANGVMITGLESTWNGTDHDTIAVRVWAVDEGLLPANDTDSELPADGNLFTITVTVDGAPYMGEQSSSSITLNEIQGGGAVVGTVYNPESADLAGMTVTATPDIKPNSGEVDVSLDGVTDFTAPRVNGRPIRVIGTNTGSVDVVITVTEGGDAPNQYVKHTVSVMVAGS